MKDNSGNIGKISSFEQAAEDDVLYYARISWKESAQNAEIMRKMIWSNEYGKKMDKTLSKRKLKDREHDIE